MRAGDKRVQVRILVSCWSTPRTEETNEYEAYESMADQVGNVLQEDVEKARGCHGSIRAASAGIRPSFTLRDQEFIY
jgi:hypothetical protein